MVCFDFFSRLVTFHPASAELGASGQQFGIGSGEGKEWGGTEKERKGDSIHHLFAT